MLAAPGTLAQGSSTAAPGAAGGILAIFGALWCFVIAMGVGQIVIFLVALIQILSRSMPNDAKLLWGAVAWFLPIIGPILWWTIGSKQNPPRA